LNITHHLCLAGNLFELRLLHELRCSIQVAR
jgi:hypothetical protein